MVYRRLVFPDVSALEPIHCFELMTYPGQRNRKDTGAIAPSVKLRNRCLRRLFETSSEASTKTLWDRVKRNCYFTRVRWLLYSSYGRHGYWAVVVKVAVVVLQTVFFLDTVPIVSTGSSKSLRFGNWIDLR